MDEATFKLFEAFDFENNEHFQSGWSSIEKFINPEMRRSEYLRAQAFFFTRNMKTFDYQQYLQWRNSKQTQQVRSEVDEKKSRGKLDSIASDAHDNNQDQSLCVNSLSLAEVAELIKNNQPIPGVASVDVRPSNADPTPSKLMRRLKPWEVTEGGNEEPEQRQPTTEFSDAIA